MPSDDMSVGSAGYIYGGCTTPGGSIGSIVPTKGMLCTQARTHHAHLVFSTGDLEPTQPCGPHSPEPDVD